MSYKYKTEVPDREGKENNTLLYWFSAEKHLNEGDLVHEELNRILRYYNAVFKINARCLILEQNNTYSILDEVKMKYCLIEIHTNDGYIMELYYNNPETSAFLKKDFCELEIIAPPSEELMAEIKDWGEDAYEDFTRRNKILLPLTIECHLKELYDEIIHRELKKDGF